MKFLSVIASLAVFLAITGLSFIFFSYTAQQKLVNPVREQTEAIPDRSLDKYSIESLRTRQFKKSEILLSESTLESNNDFDSRMFYFFSFGKRVSGLANIPKNKNNAGVIIMLRGYVPQDIYQTGIGTKRTAQAFAQAGFITLAPDFLGYGESASPSANAMEERFETYTTVLNLLASVPNLNRSLKQISQKTTADPLKIGLWGHSNGGHIALTVLEATGKNYPTVLWAPVSKPFPYSILYYTDEYEDHGRALRKLVADFESTYDSEKYSLINYLDWITAPIQLHQGENDESVPVAWSNSLAQDLKKINKDIEYFTYSGEDHNFTQGSWTQTVRRSISFFQRHFQKMD